MKVNPTISLPVLRRHVLNLMPLPDEWWKTADGRRLKVADMDTEHVRNVLRMLLRVRREERQAKLTELRKKLVRAKLLALMEKLAVEEIGEDRKWGS